MDVNAIKNNVKVCMFDQYGTVVDMQGGLTAIATPFLKAKGWTGDPEFLRDLVAAHAFREFDDRRAPASRAHALSRDRPSRGRPCDGPRRHQTYHGRRALSGRRDREAEAVPGSAGGAGEAAGEVQAGRAVQRRPRHAGDRQALSQDAVRPRHLGRGSQLVQAARRDLHQGGRTAGPADGPDPVRRQSRLRLHRRQIGRHAHRLHRPPLPSVRRDARISRTSWCRR